MNIITEQEFRKRYNQLAYRTKVAEQSSRTDFGLLNVGGKLMDGVRRLYADCRGQYGTEEEWDILDNRVSQILKRATGRSQEGSALLAA